MLPRVMDSDQLQRACGISADAFMQCALSGAVPPSLGLYNGRPVWLESAVQAFASNAGLQFDSAWIATPVSEPAASVASSSAVASASVSEPAAAVDDEWPDEMPQGLACEYLECSASWFHRQENDGIISGQLLGKMKIYRRADLDVLKTLPVFRLRKRRGYTMGKPKKQAAPKPGPTPIASGDSYLGETAAADYLNMPRETLALARNAGSGPTCIHSNGVPKYKVADLDAWLEKNGQARKVAQVVRSTDRTMPTAAAAEYLGLTTKQLANILTHATAHRGPPAHDVGRASGTDGRARYLFSAADLETWRQENGERIAALQQMREIGARNRAYQLTLAKSKRGGRRPRLEKGPAKAPTSTRKNLAGQPMRA